MTHRGMDTDLQQTTLLLLSRIAAGESPDASELSVLLYDQLRGIARAMMAAERPGHTLQATALVNEAYLRLLGTHELDQASHDQFIALASVVMRRILIDHARASGRQKRGGGRQRVPLTLAQPQAEFGMHPDELLALDDALGQLAALDERKARVVELRFFGGLDEEATARILGIARSTAANDWRFARAWLLNKLGSGQVGTRDAAGEPDR